MIKKVLLVLVVTSLHLAFSIYSIGQASVVGHAPGKEFWLRALDVAAFPLLYVQKVEYHWGSLWMFGIDLLPILVVLNSLLWGIVFLAAYLWFKRGKAVST